MREINLDAHLDITAASIPTLLNLQKEYHNRLLIVSDTLVELRELSDNPEQLQYYQGDLSQDIPQLEYDIVYMLNILRELRVEMAHRDKRLLRVGAHVLTPPALIESNPV